MADAGIMTLAGTVLGASLLGSAHCAGMCGGLALVAAGPIGTANGARAAQQAGYHAGRLASYAALGAAAGAIGSVVDDAGVLIGVQRVAAVAAGVTIALFGLAALAGAFGLRVPKAHVPGFMLRAAQRVHAGTLRLPARWRGVPLGLATPLLPCGWLYAFAAIAAATASVAGGALVMAAFWLGTVPAIVIATNGARVLFARLGRAGPVVAALAMLAVGVHVALSRSAVADEAFATARRIGNVERAGGAPRIDGLVDETRCVADEVPPCCRSKP